MHLWKISDIKKEWNFFWNFILKYTVSSNPKGRPHCDQSNNWKNKVLIDCCECMIRYTSVSGSSLVNNESCLVSCVSLSSRHFLFTHGGGRAYALQGVHARGSIPATAERVGSHWFSPHIFCSATHSLSLISKRGRDVLFPFTYQP